MPATKGSKGIGIRGSPPKTIEQRRRLGNPGHRDLGQPLSYITAADFEGIPEPFRPLGVAGRQTWDHTLGAGAQWIATTDLALVQQLCELIDEQQMIRLQVFERPDARDTWRKQHQLRRLDVAVFKALQHLGLTPAMRTRLGVAEVRAHAAAVIAETAAENVDSARAFEIIDAGGPDDLEDWLELEDKDGTHLTATGSYTKPIAAAIREHERPPATFADGSIHVRP